MDFVNQTALIELYVHLCEFDYNAHAQCVQHGKDTILGNNLLYKRYIQYLIDAENASIEKGCNFSNLRFNIEISSDEMQLIGYFYSA